MPAFEAIILLIIHVSRAIQRGDEFTGQHRSDLEMAAKCAGIMEDYEHRYFLSLQVQIVCGTHFSGFITGTTLQAR